MVALLTPALIGVSLIFKTGGIRAGVKKEPAEKGPIRYILSKADIVPPPNRKKFVKKTGKCNQDNFLLKCYQNPLEQLSKQFSKLYQLWGPVT